MNPNFYNCNSNPQNMHQPDWGSMARQWATLQTGNYNAPNNGYYPMNQGFDQIDQNHTHSNISSYTPQSTPYSGSNNTFPQRVTHLLPPPPPPPAPETVTPLMNIKTCSYFSDNKFTNELNPHTIKQTEVYEYEPNNDEYHDHYEYQPESVKSSYYESFNYHHTLYSETKQGLGTVPSPQIEQIQPPVQKLFPVNEAFSQSVVVTTTNPIYPTYNIESNKTTSKPFPSLINMGVPTVSSTPTSKGLPAWILDDMKKIKEKERKQNVNNIDMLKDYPTDVKRDEEGDIVMEDVNREQHKIDEEYPGKKLKSQYSERSNTEADIDDISLNEDDDYDRVDYASKTLSELIDLLDENELQDLQLSIMKNSLTGIMKDVTDRIISEVAMQSFQSHLIQITQSDPTPTKDSNPTVSKSFNSPPKSESPIVALRSLIGLDAYASEDEEESASVDKDPKENPAPIEKENVEKIPKPNSDKIREKWCSNKKKSSDIVEPVKKTESIIEEDKSDKYGSQSSMKKHKHSKRERSRSKNKHSSPKKTSSHKRSRSRSKDRKRKSHRDRSNSSHYKSHYKSSKQHSSEESNYKKHHSSSKDKRHKRSRS